MIDYVAFFNKEKHPEYDFISNFHECSVVSHSDVYRCAEGLYQYQKFAYLNDDTQKRLFQNASGQQAWDLSRQLATSIDPKWNRINAMRHAIECKFLNSDLRQKLIDTQGAYLVENCPKGHDSFWADDSDGTGQNMLGILLMQHRQALNGIGVVPVPPIMQAFYSKKCTICGNSCHFTNNKIVYPRCDRHLEHKVEKKLFYDKIAGATHTPDVRLYRLFSQSPLPTRYGTMQFSVFKHCALDVEAIACVSPKTIDDKERKKILVRVHDACATSEIFHSVKCDCKLQLDQALQCIAERGGMVIYLQQEGRGIGLGNKIAAYNLQETCHLDTVDANRELGLPDDMREYSAVRDILHHFGVESIVLMSNNKRKGECLAELGIEVVASMPCLIQPQSEPMKRYMKAKADRMGHDIPTDITR